MLVLRFLATVFLLAAAIALVSDTTPFLAGAGPLEITSLFEHGQKLAPDTLLATKTAVSRFTAPWVWDIFAAVANALPTFVFFGVVAALCGYSGRRRHSTRVFAN